MKRLVAALFCLLFIFSVTHAGNDYSSIKGDYKILCLGDTRTIVIDKLNYLYSKNEVDPLMDFPGTFFTVSDIFEDGRLANVSLEYFRDKLYEIRIWGRYFSAMEVDTIIKNILLKRLKPIVIKNYGKPTIEYRYPSAFDVLKYDRAVAKWDLKTKIITLLVDQYQYEYGPCMVIQDKQLLELKNKEDQITSKKQQEKFKNDF